MDAVKYINQHKDVVKLLNHINIKGMREDNVYVRSCCPIHKGDNPTAFVINKNSGLWFCHTGGCLGGDIFTLVQKIKNISFKESVIWLASFFNINIDDMKILERQESYIKEIQNFISVMKGLKIVEQKEITLDFPMKPVVRLRSFKKETIEKFNVQFVEEITLLNKSNQNYVLKKRIVFPILVDGKTIGFSLRATSSKQVPKWSHQPVNLETRNILYNYDSIDSSNIISVVEGIYDVMACDEAGITSVVCTFGAHITDMQYKLLLKSGKDICLMFDGDDAGRAATQKAIQMFKHKTNIYVVNFPDNKDPESINREELRLLYDNREKIIRY